MNNVGKYNKEYNGIINEITEKYGYTEDLSNTLRKIMPGMLDDLTSDERQSFYKMLKHTQIVIVPEDSRITDKELQEKYLGNVNPHIETEEVDIGEYGKTAPAGAFVSEPIIDENLKLEGVKQFLYVGAFDTTKLNMPSRQKHYELFGTGIHVNHLVHELGHAFVSEKEPYSIEDDVIIQRCGTGKIKSKITSLGNGKYSIKEISREGLMLEEALNTNFEEKSISKILGISLEETKKLYRGNERIFLPSNYQGLMSEMTEYMQEKFLPDEIWKWRLTGDKDTLDKINEVMSETKEYKTRNEETEHLNNKKEIFATPESKKMAELFEKYHSDFFPNKNNMTPMQIIDNCLLQCFNITTNKMAFPLGNGLEKYSAVINSIIRDGYVLINQTADIIKEKSKNIAINTLTKKVLKDEPRITEINESDQLPSLEPKVNENEMSIED